LWNKLLMPSDSVGLARARRRELSDEFSQRKPFDDNFTEPQ